MRWVLSLIWASVALGALGVSCTTTDDDPPEPTGQCTNALSYESFAGPFFLDWCTGCHNSALAAGERQEAPLGMDFDTLDGIVKNRDLILANAVKTHAMPPAGGPSDEERELLGQWFECGHPAQTAGFDPPDPPPVTPDPPPTGECAKPREPLPAALLPRCAASTYDCVKQCALDKPEGEVDDCQEACTKADTTPADTSLGYPIDCSSCVFSQIMACGEDAGCHDEVAGLMCCVTDCAASGDPTCLESQCQDELTAFGYCVYYGAPECFDHSGSYINACYAPAAGSTDAGVGDGG